VFTIADDDDDDDDEDDLEPSDKYSHTWLSNWSDQSPQKSIQSR
jgi:hypothetical protein